MTKILKISIVAPAIGNVQNLTNVLRIWVYLFSLFHSPSSSDALVIAKELRATKLFACSLLVIILFRQSNTLRGLHFFCYLWPYFIPLPFFNGTSAASALQDCVSAILLLMT